MRRTVFLAAATLVCVLGVNAQQHNIDTQKSALTIHVGKTGAFSALGHEHEVRALIHSGTADTGSHPAVEVHVDARALRVIDKDASEKERAEVQKTMLGPEVLDSQRHQEIVFKSSGAEPAGQGRWTLRGQTRPVTVRTSAANSRRRSFIQTTSGKFDNGLNLVAIQPFEPIHNVIDVGARFQIFKDDGDRHAGAAKYPGAAYLS